MSDEGYAPDPPISVVIPTRGRPDLVVIAVESALAQTRPPAEVIVVVDGPDRATVARLRALQAARRGAPLVILELERSEGANSARNHGIAAARGSWLALLDDDDEWLPRKLERQLSAMNAAAVVEPVGSCAMLVRDGSHVGSRRVRIPLPDEPVSEFLFRRPGVRSTEGTIGSSTLVAHTSLFRLIQFDERLPRYQDADWLLRAVAAGAQLIYVPEALSIWRLAREHGSITSRHQGDWSTALAWAQARRSLMTRRAYGAFVLARAGALAVQAREWRAAIPLMREAMRHGQPGLVETMTYVVRWFLPRSVRRALRGVAAREVRAPH